MIVLDTNVVSEMMRAVPDAKVMQWMNAQAADELWLNSIVVSELLFGVARLPAGARRQQLTRAVQATIDQDFADRIAPFGLEAAVAYAQIASSCEAKGRPIDMADAQIAAICVVHDAALATRNTKHFEGLGLKLINPWA